MTKRKARKGGSEPSPFAATPGSGPTLAARQNAINWRHLAILSGVIAVVAFVIYINTFWMGLVFNDNLTLSNAIGTGTTSIADVFVRPFTQPWVRTSFLTDISHYQSQFGWYHFVNVWLHLSTCVALALVVFLVAWRKRVDTAYPEYPYMLAGVAGLIYACHPFAVQTATYLSARYASMGASNFLFALLFAGLVLGTAGAIRIWCGLLLVAFSLMCLASSEVALALGPSVLALIFLLKPAKPKWIDWAIDHPLLVGLSFVASLLVPFYLMNGFDPLAASNFFGLPKLEPAAYYATQAKALLTYYTRCFVVPIGLSIDPPYSQAEGFADVLAILGMALLGGIVYAAVRWRSRAIIVFAIWLTLAGFLPHAVIWQQDAVSDAAIYLAVGGMSTLAAWFLLEIFTGTFKAVVPKLVAVLLILAGLSVAHNLDFRTEQSLLASVLSTNPNSELGMTLAAMEKVKKDDYAGAIKESDEALTRNPRLAVALFTKGQAQLHLEHYSEAQASFEAAIKIGEEQHLPIVGSARYALAETYVAMNRLDKADEVLQAAMKTEPQHPRSVYVLGLMSLKKRDFPAAMVYLQRALQNGVGEAALPAGRALLGVKDYDEALAIAKHLQTKRNSPEVQLLLGNASLAVNDLPTAEKALKEVVKVRREDAEALALLSIVYERQGDKVLAGSYHKDAVKRDPEIFSKLLLPGNDSVPVKKQTVNTK